MAGEGLNAKSIVMFAVALLLVAYLFPIALTAIYDANITGWAAVVVTIFQTVLPIIAVIAIALKFLGKI